MTRILVPSEQATDWRRLLADPAKQWRRGYSARTTALSWTTAKGAPPEIASMTPVGAELLFAAPEWKTGLPGGGRESQSDVFALFSVPGGLLTMTVEAKVDEPFGPTLGEWMEGASPGKRARIAAIGDLLGLAAPIPAQIRYQLLHRAAAALVEARRFRAREAAMIVQSFSPESRWFDEFAHFAALFGLAPGPGEPAVAPVPEVGSLRIGWATGDPMYRDAPYAGGEDTGAD